MNAHASATATPPSFTQATNDACRTLTGKHPADLLCLLTELHGAFKELDALLYTIASAAQDTDTPWPRCNASTDWLAWAHAWRLTWRATPTANTTTCGTTCWKRANGRRRHERLMLDLLPDGIEALLLIVHVALVRGSLAK